MKNSIIKIGLVLNLIILAVPLLAFPGDPDGGEDPPFEPDPLPIDNQIWVLIFLAICLAFAFLMRFREKTKTF